MKVLAKRLIDRCWDLSEAAADESGFVSLRNLAQVAGCKVVARPLLAEAVIARDNADEGKWVAFINSDQHKYSEAQWEQESHSTPLNHRTRNTVAHELAHAVAVDLLGLDFGSAKSNKEKLNQIEKLVEKASPMLLLPKSSIQRAIEQITCPQESLKMLSEARRRMAVSREIFISTLKTYNKLHRDKVVAFDGLLESSYGVMDLQNSGRFFTPSWWVFDNHHKKPRPAHMKKILVRNQTEWEVVSTILKGGRALIQAKSKDYEDAEKEAVFEVETSCASRARRLLYRVSNQLSLL